MLKCQKPKVKCQKLCQKCQNSNVNMSNIKSQKACQMSMLYYNQSVQIGLAYQFYTDVQYSYTPAGCRGNKS